MIKGIGGQPYINLDPYIDIDTYKKLHYKLCEGLVKSEYKKEGNMVKPGGCEGAYDLWFKPIYQVLEEYHELPDDHEIKQIGKKIGEYDNRDQFILFLKLSMGAYDPYQFIFIKSEEGGWESRFEEKQWTSDSKYFPELRQWLEKLVSDKVFEHLGRVIFFKAEHDVFMPLHRDLILPNENDYTDHRHEFIHIRTNLDKPVYIWDGKDKKIRIESHATFFNDQDWHAGGKTPKQTFSLRIDGKFTESFRKKIGIGHLENY